MISSTNPAPYIWPVLLTENHLIFSDWTLRKKKNWIFRINIEKKLNFQNKHWEKTEFSEWTLRKKQLIFSEWSLGEKNWFFIMNIDEKTIWCFTELTPSRNKLSVTELKLISQNGHWGKNHLILSEWTLRRNHLGFSEEKLRKSFDYNGMDIEEKTIWLFKNEPWAENHLVF